ncbi:MAG: ABC transporter ATP-binding protein [Proteobacteria bacterium]|nr:ABC transporter ATP-binding protein [Pseudomonadota bacterium]
MLEITGLTSGYGGARVLSDVECKIPDGKVTALMGRNGMGKTTFIKTIMGLLKTEAGSIRFDGAAIERLSTFEISRLGIGYVPQGREVFDQFTVLENLRLSLLGHSIKSQDGLDQIYEWFPILKERADQRAGTFSGGQQQILAIARALIANPRMLLLDEPTEGIQPSIVHEIGEKLAAIAKETGLTILVVEQNVDMVRTIASDALFMENGQIVDSCSISELERDDSLLRRYLSV